ncbi:MAG: cyclase family protein [Chloroflexota bacterium]|nr:cyclase family protein [Chloroflexota bacterium]
MPNVPTEAEVIAMMDSLSNWGRWGDDDQLGTLNYVTPEVRKAAAGLVTEGVSVSCAWDIENTHEPDHAMGTPQRFMVATGESAAAVAESGVSRMSGALEFFGLVYHGYAITHLDGLCHIFWDGKMYNGKPAHLVNSGGGATDLPITELRDGIVTRGVLLDVAAAKGVDWMEPGEGVFPEDLEAAEERQGVRVREGDAVLLRTGYGKRKREVGREPLLETGFPGWHVASLPWLHERGAAVIGADTATDVNPSGYETLRIPIHAVGIVHMGLWLMDNMQLEDVAAAADRYGRHEFQFVLSPLRIIGGTGSPANPLAIF